LRRCPFVVVSDVSATTDNARHATVLLPAAAWGEKDGTVTNSERRISRQRAFTSAPGDARRDWWLIKEVAARLGFAEAFTYAHPADIFREFAALSGFENDGERDFDISGLCDLDRTSYEQLEPTQWPLPAGAARAKDTDHRFFADGRFFTANKRAVCVAVAEPQAKTVQARYPYHLNTGRVRDQWHPMTRTGRAPRHLAEPYVEINPADAYEHGIRAADLVRVEAPAASVILRALLSSRQQRGSVFVPMH
jgi:assimilatory nitrate reductase catalytic subunit